jgi:hypothetical protein
MLTTRMIVVRVPRFFIFYLLMSIVLTGCTGFDTMDPGTPPLTPSASPGESTSAGLSAGTSASACPVSEPVWAKPPDDPAVQGSPEYGYYFVNQDRSIWASAWWTEDEEYHLRVSEEGVKVGWFRPAGAVLEITGQRLDAQAPPLETHVPCCYPTRFQATGLILPTEGCWEVTAKAADSELSFVLSVEP